MLIQLYTELFIVELAFDFIQNGTVYSRINIQLYINCK